MKVKLIRYTPDAEKLVASAGRLCYSPVGVEEIEEDITEKTIDRMVDMFVEIGHQSTLEHATFTFGVEGVSRSLTHQLVRHRIASYSQQSQRYVKLDQFEYIVPPNIKDIETAKNMYKKHMEETQSKYDKITLLLLANKVIKSKNLLSAFIEELGKTKEDAVQEILYHMQILDNFEEEEDLDNTEDYFIIKDMLSMFKKAFPSEYSKLEKESIEDARYLLPNACDTKIVFTMNARTLLHFFKLRACNRAQWEIRELADKMIIELKKVYPILFKNAGASCISGKCPEGNMSCGSPRSREEYERVNK